MKKSLSKTKYMSGLQCRKRLWHEVHRAKKGKALIAQKKAEVLLAQMKAGDSPTQMEAGIPIEQGKTGTSTARQHRLDQGNEVENLARFLYFSDGEQIDGSYPSVSVKRTSEALDKGATCLFRAMFKFNSVTVRCDVLKKDGDAWQLTEIKSSMLNTLQRKKNDFLQELAIQKYVLEGCGLSIAQIQLMLIDSEACAYPDLSNFFAFEDVSDEVDQIIDSIDDKVEEFKAVINSDEEPQIAMGEHCNKPYRCQFTDYCQLSAPKVISITQDQDEVPCIDSEAIQACMAKLEYPIHFLDFETNNPAIPRHDGMHPYQHYPFQYSCYILFQDGKIDHYEYLHTDKSDPRQALTESLLDVVYSQGSIIAYYARFESDILEGLIDFFPDYAPALQTMIDRLWDQWEIFKYHYSHPDFHGSTSLKNVLPVLVPSLSYESLNIHDGAEAQAIWNQLIKTENENERGKIIADLKTYCEQDTWAMVEILKVLSRI